MKNDDDCIQVTWSSARTKNGPIENFHTTEEQNIFYFLLPVFRALLSQSRKNCNTI